MLIGGGLVALAVFALWIYCVLDVIATEEALMRNMPKVIWLIVVILLPTIGSVAWLLLGRPTDAGFVPGDTSPRPPLRERPRKISPRGPEDSPEFMSGLDERADKLKKWEEDLKRREDELRRREEGDPPVS